MSLLQYGFERKRIRDDSLQNDDNEDNSTKVIKKLKWLTEFFLVAYLV